MGVKCGVLSSNPHRDVSSLFTDFVAGALYDLIIDYPYNGATGGKIGIFSEISIAGEARTRRVGWAYTGYGGVRLTFRAPHDANWSQVIFQGDNETTAAVAYYILLHVPA